MKLQEYLNYALTNKLYRKLEWFYNLFVINVNTNNKYIKVINNQYFVNIEADGEVKEVLLEGVSVKEPVFKMSDKYLVDNNTVENLLVTTNTYLGRILVNKILLADIFGNRIPFINGSIKSGMLETILANELSKDKISILEYLDFIKATTFMHGLSRITTYAATPKSMLPPKGLEAFKKKLMADMKASYGEDWVKDRAKIVEFENALRAYDNEWLADDPSLGKLLSGKVKDGARTKMYLTFGAERGFDKKSGKADLVTNSLLEGYPKDKELLTNMFNTSRSGSYDRGKETQKGGAAAKDILRATSSLTISDADCGSVVGKIVVVTKNNHNRLMNRYIILPNKSTELITDSLKYVGQTITIRSPQYCIKKGNELCAICVGKSIADYKKGISILVTDISGILLATSMAAMHFKSIQTMDFNIIDAIR
jgi:hypothetical protein